MMDAMLNLIIILSYWNIIRATKDISFDIIINVLKVNNLTNNSISY